MTLCGLAINDRFQSLKHTLQSQTLLSYSTKKSQNALKNTTLEIMWPNSTILFLCNKYMFHVMLTDSHLIIF